MRVRVWWLLFGITLGTLLSTFHCRPTADWDQTVLSVVKKLERSYYKDGAYVDLLGHRCHFQVDGTVPHLRVAFTCPHLPNITGKARPRNRFGVVDGSVRDFFQRAIPQGLVGLPETNAWLAEPKHPYVTRPPHFPWTPVRYALSSKPQISEV